MESFGKHVKHHLNCYDLFSLAACRTCSNPASQGVRSAQQSQEEFVTPNSSSSNDTITSWGNQSGPCQVQSQLLFGDCIILAEQ